MRTDEAVAGARERGSALLFVRVLSPGVSQTAVHLAENYRKWPNLCEVDYALSKSGDVAGPTGGVVCPFGGLIGPMGGGLRPSMRTLTR